MYNVTIEWKPNVMEFKIAVKLRMWFATANILTYLLMEV
jgi:hypothetical protein